ncbi:MAG: hydantoinase B/oxoprolinase family protein [bacterium]|nr:hydantoinase B/oxoprolinase family protein [bacterium]
MSAGSKGPRRARALDSVRLEVFHHLFAAAAEEMGVALMRSAFSPNIKERRDFSCALFDKGGQMIAQAAHLPVHLGSSPPSLAAAREAIDMQPGDAVVLNDPYQGGTHLPDITLVSPVFLGGGSEPDFFCVNRAHHADVGGAFPGSMAPAADVHGEGLRLPPVRLVRAGEVDRELMRLLRANMRVPAEREADLLAQWAANRIGAERLTSMAAEHGLAELALRAGQLVDWTDALMRDVIGDLPRGRFTFADELEHPHPSEERNVRIAVTIESDGERLRFDFSRSDDQAGGPVNTVRAVAVSAVFYVLRLLLPPGTPTNAGVLRSSDIVTRPGSLVDAVYPAPVAAGNVETSQRLVDVLMGALARALPERVPAASAGTMSNLTFGAPGGGFAYYETIAGGAGASPAGPGAHAVQTHMTNTRNTPIEALETQLPVRVLAYTVRRGSGGAGARRGGDGVRKRLRFLAPVRAGWIAERQEGRPWGLAGGAAGGAGSARLLQPGAKRDARIGGKAAFDLEAGAELELRTPGGGGHGSGGS